MQCQKNCSSCPVTARIIIECHDKSVDEKEHIVDLHKNTMSEFYNTMISDPLNNVLQLAIVLKIDGVDLEIHCPHHQNDIELF